MGLVRCIAQWCKEGHGDSYCQECLVASSSAELSLRQRPGPPVLLRGPADTTALRGDRVVLKATYTGVPEPTAKWIKGV